MKSLSAHHFRSARAALPAARAYRKCIDDALAVLQLSQPEQTGEAAALLVVAADLGLCGGYNSRLAKTAIDLHKQLGIRCVYCVGHRPISHFKRAAVKIDRDYGAPTSVSGLTDLLLRLGEDLLVDYLDGRFGALHLVSAQFDGVGKFTPIHTRLLPVDPPRTAPAVKPSSYVSADHLASVAIREYLYIRLFQTLLDSLASEHGARLVATEAAGEWLAEKTDAARRQLTTIRHEAATQEVLDIAATARRRRQFE